MTIIAILAAITLGCYAYYNKGDESVEQSSDSKPPHYTSIQDLKVKNITKVHYNENNSFPTVASLTKNMHTSYIYDRYSIDPNPFNPINHRRFVQGYRKINYIDDFSIAPSFAKPDRTSSDVKLIQWDEEHAKMVSKKSSSSNDQNVGGASVYKDGNVKDEDTSSGGWTTYEMTSYIAMCSSGCTGITADGTNVRNKIKHNGKRIIAADPSILPLGTTVKIKTSTREFIAVVKDTGGAIKGKTLDLLVKSREKALANGRQEVKVQILQ